jgi:hypothetical protein
MTENGLSGKQLQFIEHLMAGLSQVAAGAACGISPRTSRRWMLDAHVRAALNEAQAQAIAHVARKAAAAMADALDTLSAIMTDDDASHGARVSAARAILENGLRFNDAVTLAARVAELEEALHVAKDAS